ncbi:MAG: hypothetical protein ACI944_002093 [Natronomonas sp.]|jgi:hypothetical protein
MVVPHQGTMAPFPVDVVAEGLYTEGQPPVHTVLDDTPEAARVKASLRRLAQDDEAAIIEQAAEATDNVECAARFVETIGTDQLAAAVEATDDPALKHRGRRALEAFRLFRRAATGDYRPDSGDRESNPDRTFANGRRDDHFHRGHGTDLSRDGEPFSR